MNTLARTPPATTRGEEGNAPAPAERIAGAILFVRGQKVMLDADLAALYGVATRVLMQAVRRNIDRFPSDFMFRITNHDVTALRSQIVISKLPSGRGGRRYAPHAFTEHGALMAATVLNTPRAVEMSRYVVRAFVRLREMIGTNEQLARKLDELERRIDDHDGAIAEIVQTIRKLMAPSPATAKRKIGFI